MKRYEPSATNTKKLWPNLDIKVMEASMVECENGKYVEYSPMLDAATEMYAMLVEFEEFTSKMHYQGRSLTVKESIRLNKMTNKLLAKVRGE